MNWINLFILKEYNKHFLYALNNQTKQKIFRLTNLGQNIVVFYFSTVVSISFILKKIEKIN